MPFWLKKQPSGFTSRSARIAFEAKACGWNGVQPAPIGCWKCSWNQ